MSTVEFMSATTELPSAFMKPAIHSEISQSQSAFVDPVYLSPSPELIEAVIEIVHTGTGLLLFG